MAQMIARLRPHVNAGLRRERMPDITIQTRASRFCFASLRGVDEFGVTIHTLAQNEFFPWTEVEMVDVCGTEFRPQEMVRGSYPLECAMMEAG